MTIEGAQTRGLVVRVLVLHALLIPAVMTGVSTAALVVFGVTYFARIFGVTAGYHRLFSHRAFSTSRWFAFALAWLGASSGQRGPLWWAAVHRRHHRTSDTVDDIHSPFQRGLLYAHLGWILEKRHLQTKLDEVPDWSKHRELLFLDRFHLVAPASLVVSLFALGHFAGDALGTSGLQLVAWGFVVSTLAEMHMTSSVNSLAHRFGRRAYDTGDHSGNLWWLALPSLGDAWHNNHHHAPGSARHGFLWWQLDATYWILRALAAVGVVWDLREPTATAATRDAARATVGSTTSPTTTPSSS